LGESQAMTCPVATYDSPDRARAVRRAMTRHWNFPISVYQCEKCDQYHLRANYSKIHIPKRAIEVLRLIALGYTTREICERLGISFKVTEWYSAALKEAFNAMSAPHLVFICTALGVLDATSGVPELTERCNESA
jgi:DNA-binding CsgD family transcriptional regulator